MVTEVQTVPTLLSLRDIAALARVQRPVVSMWRSRKASTDTPFPAPAIRTSGRDLFKTEHVLVWLEQTGLGNNDETRQDAALFMMLDEGDDSEALFALSTRLGFGHVVAPQFDARATKLAARVVAEAGHFTAVRAPGGEVASIVDLADQLGGELPQLLVPATTSSSTRLLRRHAFLAGWRPTTTVGDAVWTSGATAVVAHFPNVVEPALSAEETLKRISEISLGLKVGDLAVVLAPANVLVAPLRDEALLLRADVLRTGTVRAIVHLPAGLWTTRPRQRLALWILGDAHSDIPREQRWITVADLEGVALDEPAGVDLVSDTVATLGDARSVRGHAFRFARTVAASSVLATDGALVRPRARPVRRAREAAADTALRVKEIARQAADPAPLLNFDVEPHELTGGQFVTLGELIDGKRVRVLPGARLRQEDIGEGVPVIGPTEVLAGHHSARGIDRLVLAASYPSFRYTEPGDVVFCASPQLRAFADENGFGAAEAPVRILRIIDSDAVTLRPEVIAAAVNCAPDGPPGAWLLSPPLCQLRTQRHWRAHLRRLRLRGWRPLIGLMPLSNFA